MTVDPALLKTLEWRCIGPPRGGRVVAVAGDPSDPMAFYFGACAGGVWKSTDGGTYWENVSDGFFKTASVGAIAVSEADPNVVYAGMGESCIRGDVSHGDGVYRSTDRGKTWVHAGLEDTRHIARIRIDPKDPDLVYVAALGHAFGPNDQRGVFRSGDGGRSWEQVLFRSERAGAIDLSLDPSNPRVLYAALWEAQRTPWSLVSGGHDSGIFRSEDGGDTWEEITHNPGLPGGLKGRIGVAVSPARSGRVWATIEAEDCGLFRSDDGGATWELMSDNRDLQGRPWYYQHVFADPRDPDTVWILNYKCWRSVDGGRTFTEVSTTHDDNHDLWIDPVDPRRMIEGNDGGASVSFNGGESWSTIYNQLTAQFYHVAADNQFPYRVYGTQQDNSAISVPSRNRKGVIPWGDCYTVGTAESGHIAIHPRDPNIVFAGAVGSSSGGGGNLLRYDHSTGQTRIVTVWPELYTGWGARDMKYRFQWTYPILFSPHDPDVLYVAGNVVFRSTDQGSSWEAISPDLTRNDLSKQGPSGGPITRDTSGAEVYGTVFAFAESPHEKGVLWAGSDDGLVHISRDGGLSWEDITPKELPEWCLICNIEPSPHNPAVAYMAATRYRSDDTIPLIYKTPDYGATWTKITGGIPETDFIRVVREDPVRPGLLYSGTETGIYASFDDGASWQPIQANLPRVPVYDLAIKDGDLVAATHGRSFWIMDDLTLLHQMPEQVDLGRTHLFKPRPTHRMLGPRDTAGKSASDKKEVLGKKYRVGLETAATFYERPMPGGESRRIFLDAGQNPPEGVVITYYLKEKPEGGLTLEIMDHRGGVITSFSSGAEEETRKVTAEAGMNRFVWNMHYPPARTVPGDKTTEEDLELGPLAPPGTFQVRLTVDGEVKTEDFQIVKDLRSAIGQKEFEAQFDLLIKIRDKLSETHDAINGLRSVRKQVDEWVQRAGPSSDDVSKAAGALQKNLSAIEKELLQVEYQGARDRLHQPARLNKKLAELSKVVASGDYAPTKQAYDVFRDLSGRIDRQLKLLNKVTDTDVAEFNDLVKKLGLPAIVPPPQHHDGPEA
ncbi:MAG: glycosyl hydrolase [Chloroflexi bacterium]|nr:glycosyl hydrolase [Chloroflexota bacterium]